MRTIIIMAVSLVLVALAGCVPQPKQDYTIAQIARIDALKELMRINAHVMDPLFSIRYQPVFSTAEKAAAERAGERVLATSAVVRDRLSAKRPKGFAVLADRLHNQARDVMVAAQADRDPDISVALDSIREVCSDCHRKYR